MKYIASNSVNYDRIIIYAGCDHRYFADMLNKTKDMFSYDAIITNNTNISGTFAEELQEVTIEDIKKNSNIFVMIVQDNIEQIRKTANQLREYGISFDHISNYCSDISIQILDALGYHEYIDGNNNSISFESINKSGQAIIRLAEKDVSCNRVNLKNISISSKMTIALFGNNSQILLGNSSYNQVTFHVTTNGKIEVGDDCMFSHDILISQTDQHLIFDLYTHKRINANKNVKIGNHVWIGRSAKILGGARIPDNCIVGQGTITSASFKEKNCVIAGSPGMIIRKNIIWARDSQKNDYGTYELCEDTRALKYLDDDYSYMNNITYIPYMVSAVNIENAIVISWEKVYDKPLFYRIYRKLCGESEWKCIGETENNYYKEYEIIDFDARYTVRAVYKNQISNYDTIGIAVNDCK